ncbi:MAG: queuosine precursor transporter [Longimonas sp.]|uniref:queuosine precursor transporter n=1 Tax=Longimonas sp. TaxID=2039626 RepID=UPI003357B7BE
MPDSPPPSHFSAADTSVLRESSTTRAEIAFLMLAGVFIGALVMTNAIAGKFFVLFGQELSAGIIAYPVTFLVTDLISELFGRKRASTVVGVGFVVSVFVTLVVWIAGQMPVYEASPVSQEAFDMVFGLMPGIVLGSMIAYLTAQYIDVQIFEWLRGLTKGKYMWIRNNGSTFFSQLVDTTMVVTIALVWWPQIDGNPQTEAIAWSTWQGIVFGQYVFKIGIAALDTPVLYVCEHWLREWIEADPKGRASEEVSASAPASSQQGVER